MAQPARLRARVCRATRRRRPARCRDTTAICSWGGGGGGLRHREAEGHRGSPRVVWRSIVRKGDTVVDATCGNGNDTLALLKMVTDERGQGHVYGMDIQCSAIESTSSFLKMAVDDGQERELVKLFPICHSRMEDIVPKDSHVRLVAFNLGYLPGGDKTVITVPRTTELALQAASRILSSGGLISVLVYIGHPGGRDELDVVESFASSLPPVDTWASCKLQMVNRPIAPVLILLNKR